MGERVKNDDEFWELFREAMRKLAARCRRVRHAKKVRLPKAEVVVVEPIVRKQQQFQQQYFEQQQISTNQSYNYYGTSMVSQKIEPKEEMQQNDNSINNISITNDEEESSGMLIDVNEAEEFSSSQSSHTPNSSITHNSTPTSVIKEEEHDN